MAKKSLEDRFMDAADSASKAGDTLAEQRMSGGYSLTGRDGRRFPKNIRSRPNGGTRNLDPLHVLDLAESIAALGLLQPIAVDKKDRLVAGEHRLEACRLLDFESSDDRTSHWNEILLQTDKIIKKNSLDVVKTRILKLDFENHKKRYADKQIPVLTLPIDSEKDKEAAFAAETAENEKRQNYTKQEIISLAERLREAGYIERPGRPKKGEKSIKNTLSVISGKSFRQIERDLNGSKTPTHVGVSQEQKELEKITKDMAKFSTKYPSNEFSQSFINLNKKIKKHLDTLESATSDK
jgi:ParB-like chromosome segregation protein Spo0J